MIENQEQSTDHNVATPPRSDLSSLWRRARAITRHQWLYLPRLLSRREKIAIGVFVALAVVSLITLIVRVFLAVTVPSPAVAGMFREGETQEPRFINPLFAANDSERDIANLVFGKLIRYDPSGSVFMDLANSVSVSEDGKEYTVALKHHVTWHDGNPFSADDVAFTIRTIQDPAYKSPLGPNWQGVAVDRLSEDTVRFTLRQPYAPFLENLAVGIIPEHLWKRIPRESAILSDLNLKPVGTGPFQFEKFNRKDDGTILSMTLARNTHYYLSGPYLQNVEFLFYPNENMQRAAYRRNEIDSFIVHAQKTQDALWGLDLEFYPMKLPKLFAVFLNATAEPALGRTGVKKALAMAIDRAALIRAALDETGSPINSAIPPGTFGYNGDIAAIPYDPEQARSILAADGWKANKNGVLERTEGSGKKKKTIALTIQLVTSDAPDLDRAADRIAEMWRAIGVATEVKKMSVNELENNVIRPRNFQALLFGEVFGHDPDPFAFWHTSQLKDPGLNIALYANPAVDQLLEQARRTRDAAKREALYQQFQKIVADDMGAIFLWSPTDTYAVRKTVRGVRIGNVATPEERFNEINTWYVGTKRIFK